MTYAHAKFICVSFFINAFVRLDDFRPELKSLQGGGDQDLACVYVPNNNLYLWDIFLMSRADVIIPDLSVREAMEIVLSGSMSVPKIISAVEGAIGLGDHGRAVKDS
ncbi:unnamed protein product [Miscanthus lutarioriparius]|uniref:Uncharacterized protein n=1 Tax=Miscanthus lutarioriparius TaxID=422564 RepID=A0A811RDA8_9POAL|nr:unnamed protein product [Miscanthus lutarioriparius]